ncbi:hypothetical protein DBR40_18370 [Pedobacter sp. KBW01]|nr:hypothetical protein DBR40_18370 [Pedobacter sp. KBW01]
MVLNDKIRIVKKTDTILKQCPIKLTLSITKLYKFHTLSNKIIDEFFDQGYLKFIVQQTHLLNNSTMDSISQTIKRGNLYQMK